MSQKNKRGFWTKLKRLLTPKAPQAIIDSVKLDGAYSTDHDAAHTREADDSEILNIRSTRNSTTITPIVDHLKQYFDNKEWPYTYYRPSHTDSQRSHHLSLKMTTGQLSCRYLFRVQESHGLIAFYGILPFLIPESHRSAAMLLMTQMNYNMLIGNIEMDIEDGEIRYKNALDVDATSINDDIIEYLLQSVIAMTTVTHEIFNDLLNTIDPATDIPNLLGKLRDQADARTFFLPSQKMQ